MPFKACLVFLLPRQRLIMKLLTRGFTITRLMFTSTAIILYHFSSPEEECIYVVCQNIINQPAPPVPCLVFQLCITTASDPLVK